MFTQQRRRRSKIKRSRKRRKGGDVSDTVDPSLPTGNPVC